MNALCRICLVAANELADSLRSRRVLVVLLLYAACAAIGVYLFTIFLNRVETHLAEAMGVSVSAKTGSVTATLWESRPFRRMIIGLIGDRDLAERLLAYQPLVLFYGWLSFTFIPMLVIITSSTRIAEEIWLGSVRFTAFRVSRLQWIIGKFLGQAAQAFVALLLGGVAALIVGCFRIDALDKAAAAAGMLLFSVKGWVYALAFLGLALGISQLCSSPNIATALGIFALVAIAILAIMADHYASDGWRRIWDFVAVLTPSGHRLDLWWPDLAHGFQAFVFLAALGTAYLLAGFARFHARDL